MEQYGVESEQQSEWETATMEEPGTSTVQQGSTRLVSMGFT